VRVELVAPAHVRGVSAEAVVVPEGKDAAVLTLRFAAGAVGPFNMPLTVRAAAGEGERAVTAEGRLDVHAER
jgi:hypothetical protein